MAFAYVESSGTCRNQEISQYRVVWDGGSGFIPTEKKISVEYSN